MNYSNFKSTIIYKLIFQNLPDNVPISARDTLVLPADELRVDAVRGLLPAHPPRKRVHERAQIGQVGDGAGMDRPGHYNHRLYQFKGHQRG